MDKIEVITLSDSSEDDSESPTIQQEKFKVGIAPPDISEELKKSIEKINVVKLQLKQPWPIIRKNVSKVKKKRLKINKENGVVHGPLDKFVVRSPKSNNMRIDHQDELSLNVLPNLDTGEMEVFSCPTPIKRIKLSEISTSPKAPIIKKTSCFGSKLLFSSDKKELMSEEKAFQPPCRKKLILQPLSNQTELEDQDFVTSDTPTKAKRDIYNALVKSNLEESGSPCKNLFVKHKQHINFKEDYEYIVNLMQEVEIKDNEMSPDFKTFIKLPNSPKAEKSETDSSNDSKKTINLVTKLEEPCFQNSNIETKFKFKLEDSNYVETELHSRLKMENEIPVIFLDDSSDIDDSLPGSIVPFSAKVRLQDDIDICGNDGMMHAFSENYKKSSYLSRTSEAESVATLHFKIESKVKRRVSNSDETKSLPIQFSGKEVSTTDLDWLPNIDNCSEESSLPNSVKLRLEEDVDVFHNFNTLSQNSGKNNSNSLSNINDGRRESSKVISVDEEALDSFPQIKFQSQFNANEISCEFISDIDGSSQGSRLQLEEDLVESFSQSEKQREFNENSHLQLEKHSSFEFYPPTKKDYVISQEASYIDDSLQIFEPNLSIHEALESIPSTSTVKGQTQFHGNKVGHFEPFSSLCASEATPSISQTNPVLKNPKVSTCLNYQTSLSLLPEVKDFKLICHPYSSQGKKKKSAINHRDRVCPKYNLNLSRVYCDLCENSFVVTEKLPKLNNLQNFYRIIEFAEDDNSYSLQSVLSIIKGNTLPTSIIKLLIDRIVNCCESLARGIFDTLIESLRVQPPKDLDKSINLWDIINVNISQFVKSLLENGKLSKPAVYLVKYLVSVLATDIHRRSTAARPNKLQNTSPARFFGRDDVRILCISHWYGDILKLLSHEDSSLLSLDDEIFLLETIETLIKVFLVTRMEYIELNKVIARILLIYYLKISIEKKERFLQLMLNMRLIRYFMCAEILVQNYGFHKEAENVLLFNFTDVIMQHLTKVGSDCSLENQLEHLLLLKHLICDYVRINKEQLHWPIYARRKPVEKIFPSEIEEALKSVQNFIQYLEENIPFIKPELSSHPMCRRLFGALKMSWI